MTRHLLLLLAALTIGFGLASPAWAQAEEASTTAGDASAATNTQAAAAVSAGHAPHAPQFIEHIVDVVLDMFDVRTNENTATRYAISIGILVLALLLRRVMTGFVFAQVRRIASRTKSSLDNKLIDALEAPAGTFVMLIGIFAAVRVLKLSSATDQAIGYGATVAFSVALFWAMYRALGALLDHGGEIAVQRKLGVAAFMPWIKKTLLVVFVVISVLLIAQSLGANVKAFLAGLGIGGLAFALAAQDTLANLFGSVVVAIDQPFKIGEVIRIGSNIGMVEDIGLRSTRLRLIDKSLIVMPNKVVAAESIINLSRFTQRRFEQVIGLQYDTPPEQMDEVVEQIRQIVLAEQEVDKNSVMVFFRDFSASSLDIWVVYMTLTPDFQAAMRMKQRINLAIMRAVHARGLSFAFPTQTVHFDGEIARQLVERRKQGEPPVPDGAR